MVASVTTILSLLTILSQLTVSYLILGIVLKRFFHKELVWWKRVEMVVARHGLIFALVVSLIATLGSLFYSEVAQYNPCKLCWYQRIFMYPLVVLLWVAMMRNYSKEIKTYVISLSIVGGSISTYHYYLQRFGDPSVPCSVVGISESCAKSEFLNFGYITIPLMAGSAFLLMILFITFYRQTSV